MGIVIGIDLAVVAWLIVRAVRNGFESTLPLATFLLILFPVESQIAIPGLFDLTTQRLIVLTLLGLYLVFGRTPSGQVFRMAQQASSWLQPSGLMQVWCW